MRVDGYGTHMYFESFIGVFHSLVGRSRMSAISKIKHCNIGNSSHTNDVHAKIVLHNAVNEHTGIALVKQDAAGLPFQNFSYHRRGES